MLLIYYLKCKTTIIFYQKLIINAIIFIKFTRLYNLKLQKTL
nr:MAG TPA: hypothetical protein [Caudoviricetes sp.]